MFRTIYSYAKLMDKPCQILIMILVVILAFSMRLYSVIKYESMIHEFDPWFNYRATQYLD